MQKKLMQYAKTALQKIDDKDIIHPQICLDNGRCHWNAVTAARAERADSVWLVIAGNDDTGCIHFINSKGGKFFDETWPQHENKYHYYIVRKIEEPEYGEIPNTLDTAKKHYNAMLSSLADKILQLLKISPGI